MHIYLRPVYWAENAPFRLLRPTSHFKHLDSPRGGESFSFDGCSTSHRSPL